MARVVMDEEIGAIMVSDMVRRLGMVKMRTTDDLAAFVQEMRDLQSKRKRSKMFACKRLGSSDPLPEKG